MNTKKRLIGLTEPCLLTLVLSISIAIFSFPVALNASEVLDIPTWKSAYSTLLSELSEAGPSSAASADGYALYDIEQDGVPELICLASETDYPDFRSTLTVYSVEGGVVAEKRRIADVYALNLSMAMPSNPDARGFYFIESEEWYGLNQKIYLIS